MLREERTEDLTTLLLMAFEGMQAGLWTAMPAIINSFNPTAMTCTAKVSILMNQRMENGTFTPVSIPLLLDVPVMFPGGGGFTLTFPVKSGDEALIVFANRCIDSWWQNGGINNKQAEFRMHDLSDGFAFVGVRSQPRVLSGGVNAATAQLRSDDGSMYIELAAGHVCNVVAPGGMNITAPTVTINGVIHGTSDIIAGYGSGDQVGVRTHTHTQGPDSHGDTEAAISAPNAGT